MLAAPPPVLFFVWSFAVKKTFPWHVLVFLAPALVIYSLFSALPLADTLRLGLYTIDESGSTILPAWQLRHHPVDPQWSQSFWNAM